MSNGIRVCPSILISYVVRDDCLQLMLRLYVAAAGSSFDDGRETTTYDAGGTAAQTQPCKLSLVANVCSV